MMFGNYLKTALRSLQVHKLYTVINLAGLGAGLACFILIMIFVQYELSFDHFFDKADRIYRISQEIHPDDGSPDIEMATNSPQVAPLLKDSFVQVEHAARLLSWRTSVSVDEGVGNYANTLLADNDIFNIFDFVWLKGNPEEALLAPDSVVLTESTARMYFGNNDPLGETLILENSFTMRVVGIIQDLPQNTHLKLDLLAPISLVTSVFSRNSLENWSAQNYHTYVLLVEGSDIIDLEDQFPSFIERHIEEGASSIFSFSASRLTDIHLYSDRRKELSPPGDKSTVNAFIVVAVMVLLVACMNFMNLTTVKANQRAREVGVRKAIGAVKSQLMLQFMGESLMLTSAAVLIALLVVELTLPIFGTLLQRDLEFSLINNFIVVPFLVLLTLIVGLVSSGYPSFYLASFKPALVLKGNVKHSKGGTVFREALVVIQFSVAVVLLISSVTIYNQLKFIHSSDPGYQRDQILVLNNTGREGLGRQWDLLKEELLSNPGVLAVTASNTLPTEPVASSYYIGYEGGTGRRSMPLMLVDYSYFETFDIALRAGRGFSEDFSLDRRMPFLPDTPQTSGTYVLNQLAASQLDWDAESAIGKWIEVSCCNFGQGTVVGVVENVNYGSLRFASAPLIYAIPPESAISVTNETRFGLRQASIRIDTQQEQDVLAHIDTSWIKFKSDQPISRHFLEEDFNSLYQDEERQGMMMAAFSILAVSITCMGLYALSVHNAQRRTKEIGVRKVMGGSVWSIVLMLTNDFSRLVLFSNILAWPVAYFVMNKWLENFAYRIDLSLMMFVGSGFIVLSIAWVTVGGTAAKAANAKPLSALRYE